ncbi:MAG: glycerol-3-phosphate 1-O-acyltransferase PlsY [Nitrospira sp.]|nr:glycerol-3-phosphate 1-O-acyltransferase PlsY [Nitrospira sp.]MDD9860535.1 glycerol-3-phosphate 1-O-acyltransferase PlsY [Nitrospira sp.]
MSISPEIQGFLVCFAAYVLGSIPFGIVLSRICGTPDPRQAGSHNIGFTNVLRVSGKAVGILTLIGDMGKGWLVGWSVQRAAIPGPWVLMAVLAVVLGHLFPVFLKFRGGKGVATGLGGIAGLHPQLGMVLVALWAVAVGVWRYSSSGALMAFGALPVCSWFMTFDLEFTIFSALLGILVIVRHKGNIVRLMNGTESRLGQFQGKSII